MNCEGRESNFIILADVADYECHPVINLDKNENLVNCMSSIEIDVYASEGSENSLVNKVDKGISEPTSCETKYTQCLTEEDVGKDAEKTGPSFNDPGKTNCGVSEIDLANINSNCASNCSSETCSKRMVVCNRAETSEEQRDVITDVIKLKPVNVQKEVLDSNTSSTRKLSSLIDAENNLSLISNNTIKPSSLKGNEDQYLSSELNNASRNLICRKPRKVRLMTDILKSEFSKASSEIPISSGLVISNNIDSNGSKTDVMNNSNNFSSEKDIGKGIVKKKKKRKRFPIEEWGPHQMKSSNSGSKNARMCKKDKENKHVSSVFASSATVNASYRGLNLDVGSEKQSHIRRIDGLALKIKKKYNMPQFDGRDGDRLITEKDTFIKPKDVNFSCNYENIIDIQENPEVSEKPSRSANNIRELEAVDGIPIEIVEFLAESRRHHRLFLEENPKPDKIFLPETTNNVNSAPIVEFTKPTEDEMLKQSQGKKTQLKRKFISTYGDIPTIHRSLEVGPTSEVQSLKDPSHSKQTSAISNPNDKFGIQRRKYEGDMLGKKCSIVSCPTRCSEAHHVCFPNAPFVTSRNLEVPISKKKSKVQTCACVQKKIVKVNKQVGQTVFMVKSLAKHKSFSTITKTTGHSSEICSVNRNPADFSLPGEINKFMIESGDLKPRKTVLKGKKR